MDARENVARIVVARIVEDAVTQEEVWNYAGVADAILALPELEAYFREKFALKWQDDAPVITGWYWSLDHRGREEVVSVVPHPSMPGVVCIMENSFMGWHPVLIGKLGRKWAGPIERIKQ